MICTGHTRYGEAAASGALVRNARRPLVSWRFKRRARVLRAVVTTRRGRLTARACERGG